MKYHITIIEDFNRVIKKSYDLREEAEHKLQKKYSDKKLKAKIIATPEIKAGLILKIKDKYYKTIVKETKALWLLDNVNNPNDMYTPARKKYKKTKEDTILRWFLDGLLDDNFEDYDERFINNYYVDDGSDDEDIEELIEKELKDTGGEI